jgi:hypothetical protein
MSPGLIVLIAISTAVCVAVLVLVLYKLVRMVASRAADLVPNLSLPGRFNGRVTGGWRTRHPVGERRVRLPGVDPGRSAGDERAGRAREMTAVPFGKELLPSGDKRDLAARDERAGPNPEETPHAFPATLVAPDVHMGRSIDVKFRQSKSEGSERRVGEEAQQSGGREASVDGAAAYRQVGDEVTAVLTAAEHAAAELREAALREAERIRLDADEKAAATMAELQARRAEVDRFSEESRAAADAYAEETRRAADEKAATRVSEAEEEARRVRAEAEERSRELDAEASRRRDALANSVESMEARIESMRSVFRGAVAELDELLPTERQSRADEPEPPAEEGLDEALWPASSHVS